MKIKVKLFAFLQDQLGPVVTVEVTNPIRVTDILKQVSQLAPQLTTTLANSRLAINQEFIDRDEVSLTANDEVAIIPPVSGG
ncbi:MoaD/ThiS family protein [Lactobacillus sp. 0.1XD8-4]|uniref:Molybdopterin synthase sulfur carrier subunit n=1 Tax=Limosilactobacillus walteri TaxID=2268022 RepID=A0ABR8P9V6_9LACO|nr:MoaD/ThiS family protein [Limosilactobacillus walteri]MBD5807481.1 MoaD/ThiS family protein [Limosilactobacillus walteri]MRN06780.1 MoaD/ThiS family protein [Lactobacillus sp. 0.1XD8-4]